jgi:Putative zinc-finger
MNGHEVYREWAAAYVLGALEPGEITEFEVHLEGCEQCRRDVADLAAIPALLARIESPERPLVPEAVLARARERIEAERSALVRSRRRWRWGAVAAAILGVAAVIVVALSLGGADQRRGTTLVADANGVAAQITLSERAWGTAIDLRLEELPPLDRYVAWAVDREGTWQQVATWGPTPSGRAVVSGASSFATADVATVLVTSGDRKTTLVTATASGG